MKNRCGWVKPGDELYEKYHDKEWGVPVYDDRKMFEFIVLESAQAGLSWRTILGRREGYRKAFADFDPVKVARFSEDRIEKLMADEGIIRNRLKIRATISNAKAFLEIQKEFGSFCEFFWRFVLAKQAELDGASERVIDRLRISGKKDWKPIDGKRKTLKDLPATTPLSDAIAKELKRRGFKFMGSTIVYAHLQAVGIVNDHTADCWLAKGQRLEPRN